MSAAEIEALTRRVDGKKADLDRRPPPPTETIARRQTSFAIESTYTSNALDGNTLTRDEAANVIERGLTAGGKALRDHLDLVDHHDAIRWCRASVASGMPLTETLVRDIHRRLLARGQPALAGTYGRVLQRIVGPPGAFAMPPKIPHLMEEFGHWLSAAPSRPAAAFEAHLRLTAIHPFGEGNGRTARLLMNLMLIRAGFPPIVIRLEDGRRYFDALEQGSLAEDPRPFMTFMLERLDAALDDELNVPRESSLLAGASPMADGLHTSDSSLGPSLRTE